MSALGPDLPPHLLAKRKRKQEATTEDKPATASGARPSSDNNNQDGGEKRRKVIGPAMPPAPLNEIPDAPPPTTFNDVDGEEEDDDDEFGPALPSPNATTTTSSHRKDPTKSDDTTSSNPQEFSKQPQRDAWMTMPPTQDDLAARMDPSKPRARGFNTGKGAKGPNSAMGTEDGSSAWNETPEQKRKRLRDEMMGVVATSTSSGSGSGSQAIPAAERSKRATDLDEEAREHIAKSRGPSLMSRHEATKGPSAELEDDPSKRSFDREKDMGAGMRIDGTKRKQLLNQASGFSSKFAGGNYL
ncbi:hypothetical protein LTR78_010289 [Recurvomyces mirabilis]|uniref:DUF3752 domain-containing protein n=1 Tax=Recurvomyces mirabilis TaxID=574656 RepID=A0AAE0WF46_9PEZI|nr:hypothetical protein LTR78_010289 [Recurvomyces mirabilis]KAK5149641.1 hypothetical protein LTS14_010772 [Recurvomyces mirabilis]